MEPRQYAILLSEDIFQNNGFLIELTIRDLLILEGIANPTEAIARKHVKNIIKNTFREVGVIIEPDDVKNIIKDLLEAYGNSLSVTDNAVKDRVISYINKSSGNKEPNYAGDPAKVSKYIISPSNAERRVAALRRQERIDNRFSQ